MTRGHEKSRQNWAAGLRLGARATWFELKAQLRRPGLAILAIISIIVLLGVPLFTFIDKGATLQGAGAVTALILLVTYIVGPIAGMYQYLVAHNLYRVRYLPHGKASLLGSIASPVWLVFPTILALGGFIWASVFHDIKMGLGAVGVTLLAALITVPIAIPVGIIGATFVRGLTSYMMLCLGLSVAIGVLINLPNRVEDTTTYQRLIEGLSSPLGLGVAIVGYGILTAILWGATLWRWGRYFEGLTAVKLQRMTPTYSRG